MSFNTLVAATNWPDAVGFLALAVVVVVLVGGSIAAFVDLRKAKIAAAHQDDLRPFCVVAGRLSPPASTHGRRGVEIVTRGRD